MLKSAPPTMRAEALAALGTWAKPSELDRVDGRYRGKIERDDIPLKKALNPKIADLLNEKNSEIQVAAAKVVAKLNLVKKGVVLFDLVRNSKSPKVQKAALEAMNQIKANNLDKALEIAINDDDTEVRSAALTILPESAIAEEKAVELFEKVINEGTILEQQAAFAALGSLKGQEAVDVLVIALDQLIEGNTPLAVQLDVIEAVEAQNNAGLIQKLKTYQDSKDKDSPIADFQETLAGGDAKNGEQLFYNHEAAQCVRCHSIFETGGNAGPGLSGLSDRLTKEKILESMIDPSAVLAKGYAVVSIKTISEETISGIVLDENDEMIKLKIGKEGIKEIAKSEIANRENIPSSMPPMGSILSKKEIRDLIAFLSDLKE
jgi:putative heme-binding domain-containing protein